MYAIASGGIINPNILRENIPLSIFFLQRPIYFIKVIILKSVVLRQTIFFVAVHW